MKKGCNYVVTAYRFGDHECHSYVVGVFLKKLAAMKAAEKEEEYRGGKYSCEILEVPLDCWRKDGDFKVVKKTEDVCRKWNEAAS